MSASLEISPLIFKNTPRCGETTSYAKEHCFLVNTWTSLFYTISVWICGRSKHNFDDAIRMSLLKKESTTTQGSITRQHFHGNEKSRFLMFFPHLPNGVFLWCRLCALRMFLAMGSEEIIDCVEVELAEATLVRIEQDCRQSVLTNCSPETLLRKGSIRACRHRLLHQHLWTLLPSFL